MKNCTDLFSNFSQSKHFSKNSFVGILHENKKWDSKKYWNLDLALFNLAQEHSKELLPREIIWPIHNIYNFILNCITSHLSAEDSYNITNLSNDSVYEWKERLELVFEGFFKGQMPENDDFEYINPLL